MIKIMKSKTADTRSCNWLEVSKEQLQASSQQHIGDVRSGMEYFRSLMEQASARHDIDKLTDIDHFHADFITGFKETGWWDNHRKTSRHHLLQDDGISEDVNLVDIIEMIVDCVMAGMGRVESVYPLEIKPEVLKKAFDNTVELLKSQIVVD